MKDFCKCYKNLRRIENQDLSSDVLSILFEDLVYKYDETVKKIIVHLGEHEENHSRKRQAFNSDRSIENTQLFLSDKKFFDEVKIIEQELKEYLYEFPYERKADCSKTF